MFTCLLTSPVDKIFESQLAGTDSLTECFEDGRVWDKIRFMAGCHFGLFICIVISANWLGITSVLVMKKAYLIIYRIIQMRCFLLSLLRFVYQLFWCIFWRIRNIFYMIYLGWYSSHLRWKNLFFGISKEEEESR